MRPPPPAYYTPAAGRITRRSALAAHVGWDVLLHLSGIGAEYTPHWDPWPCVCFDLVMAGAVLASSRRWAAD